MSYVIIQQYYNELMELILPDLLNENLQILPLTASLEHKIEKFREKADNENMWIRTDIEEHRVEVRVIDKLTHKACNFYYRTLPMTPYCEHFSAASYRGTNPEIRLIMERLFDAESQWIIESNEDDDSQPFKLSNLDDKLRYRIWEDFYSSNKYAAIRKPGKPDTYILKNWDGLAKNYDDQTDYKIEIKSDDEFHFIVTSTETPITYIVRRKRNTRPQEYYNDLMELVLPELLDENLQILPPTETLNHKIEKFIENAEHENMIIRVCIEEHDAKIIVIDRTTYKAFNLKSRNFHYKTRATTPFCEYFYASPYSGTNPEIQLIMERIQNQDK